MNANVKELCGISAAAVNRLLASLTAEGRLVRCRVRGHWTYRRPDSPQ